ncbi:hypothetical protein D3C86_1985700 [compost metagenome]
MKRTQANVSPAPLALELHFGLDVPQEGNLALDSFEHLPPQSIGRLWETWGCLGLARGESSSSQPMELSQVAG